MVRLAVPGILCCLLMSAARAEMRRAEVSSGLQAEMAFEKPPVMPLEEFFAGQGTTPKRNQILANFADYLAWAYSQGIREVFVGGSMLTDKPEPNDIDVTVAHEPKDQDAYVEQVHRWKASNVHTRTHSDPVGAAIDILFFFRLGRNGKDAQSITLKLDPTSLRSIVMKRGTRRLDLRMARPLGRLPAH